MSATVLDDGWLVVPCQRCGRTIRHLKTDIRGDFDGREHWTYLLCPGCGYDNIKPDSKPESPKIPR